MVAGMPTTAVVIPCFNEARRLDLGAFEVFAREHADVRFVLVDDGSSDATLSLLKQLAQSMPRQFEVLPLPDNRGKAEAVRAGLARAFASGAELAGYWDADLATPLGEIPKFMQLMRERPDCLLVMGARVSLLGRDIERSPARHYLGRVFATVAASALGLAVYDTQCGAKLLRADPVTREALEQPFVSRWIFDVELLARLVAGCARTGGPPARERIVERPLRKWRDVAGSRLKPGDFARAVLELAQIARQAR